MSVASDNGQLPKLAKDLVRSLLEQTNRFQQPIHLTQRVTALEQDGDHFVLVTERERFPTRAIIIEGHDFGKRLGWALLQGSSGTVLAQLTIGSWSDEVVVECQQGRQGYVFGFGQNAAVVRSGVNVEVDDRTVGKDHLEFVVTDLDPRGRPLDRQLTDGQLGTVTIHAIDRDCRHKVVSMAPTEPLFYWLWTPDMVQPERRTAEVA